MQRLSLTKTVGPNDPTTVCEFLAEFTALSKSRVKDAMGKGAVWLKRQKGKQQRIRRATALEFSCPFNKKRLVFNFTSGL